MRFPNSILSAAAGIVLATAASAASASAVDVQFSNGAVAAQSGAAVTGGAGDVWNNVTGGTGSGVALVSTSGAASGVSLSFSSDQVYESDASYTQFTGTPYESLMRGYLVDRGTTGIALTFSGLVAGQSYGLYIYTQGDDNSANRSIGLSVNGAAAQSTTQSNASTFIAGDNYLYLTTTANAKGQIIVDGDELSGEGNINGVQLLTIAVPEPGTIALVLAGILIVGTVTRRKSRGR